MKPRSSCELCGAAAAVYCSSDSAFLCAGCDARVHGANFLAARHVRTPIACTSPSNSSIYHNDEDDSASSSSVRSAASSCISTAESAPSSAARRPGDHSITSNRTQQLPLQRSRTRRPTPLRKKTSRPATRAEAGLDARAEGVLSAWCITLGDGAFGGSTANCAAVVASHAMAVGLRRLGAKVHPRVCAAAAVWFAFNLSAAGGGGKDSQRYSQCLRRLEDCSGVPARIIAAAESKLARVVRRRQQLEAEGWAESNDECTV